MGLGDDQGVAVVHRGDIQEGQDLRGFQDPHRRQLPGGNAAKNTVSHDSPFSGNGGSGQFLMDLWPTRKS